MENKNEIENYDVSALAPIFELAKNILLEEYEYSVVLLEGLYSKNDVNSHMLESWPLFMKFRNSQHYTAFKERHIEDFNVATFELTAENAPQVSDEAKLAVDDTDGEYLPNKKEANQEEMALA